MAFIREDIRAKQMASRNEISEIAGQMNRLAASVPSESLNRESYEVRGRKNAAGIRIRCKQKRCRFDLRFKLSADNFKYGLGKPLTLSHCAIFHQ